MRRHLRALFYIAWVWIALSQGGAACAESVKVTGSLVAVTRYAVWVRQANGVLIFARLPDEGALAAQTLAGRHKVGDQVLLKCSLIDQVHDDNENEWFDLQADKLDYLRPPSAAELASALGSTARRRPGRLNLLPAPATNEGPAALSLKSVTIPDEPSPASGQDDPAAKLTHFRELTWKWLSALPNFTADESTSSYRSQAATPPKWQTTETLQSEVSFRGTQEIHRNIVRNGEKWNDPFALLPPAARASLQHGLLANIFDPNCSVTLTFSKRALAAGTPVLVYHFTAPPDSCFGPDWGRKGEGARFYAGHQGDVAFAETDGLVRRLESSTTGLPKGFYTQSTESRATWDILKIGDERYLLPIDVQTLVVRSDGTMNGSVRKFKNHRHFEADSNITYK
jgi:hypothetical protein